MPGGHLCYQTGELSTAFLQVGVAIARTRIPSLALQSNEKSKQNSFNYTNVKENALSIYSQSRRKSIFALKRATIWLFLTWLKAVLRFVKVIVLDGDVSV